MTGSPPTTHRRADIQGLRALAVAAVVAYHVTGWPTGGYLGVDVFFVVSGFVITGVLLREREATGRTSLRAFWARRVRRILPLALLVVAVVVLAAPMLYAPAKVAEVRADGLWSTFFAANWHFAADASDYFAQGDAPSPLLHYWSLAVEEQYYLAWPLLVLLAVALARGRTRAAVAGLAGVIGGASLVWAVLQGTNDPTTAYYSTLTRAWELALGAGLATISGYAAGRAPAARTVASWAGLAAIATSCVVVTGATGSPWPGAVGAVAGTALVLVAGIGSPVRGVAPLTNRASGYVGDISYGLYLWHFPLVVLAPAVLATSTTVTRLVVVAVTVLLAVVSHHLVERPVLDAPRAGRPTWREWWVAKRRGMAAALVAVALAAGGVAAVAVGSPGVFTGAAVPVLAGETDGAVADPGPTTTTTPPPRPSTPAAPPTSPTTLPTPTPTPTASPTRVGWTPVPLGDTGTRIQHGLRGALAATSWPSDLNPSPSDWETTADQRPIMATCAATDADDPDACTFGNPKGPEIIVYGDSLAFPLLATVEKAYGARYKIRGLTKIACAVNGVDADFGRDEWAIPCVNHREMTVDYVRKHRPAVLIMIETYSWAQRLKSGARGSESAAEWLAADQKLVDRVRGSVGKVVIVGASMPGVAFQDCYRPGGSPRACVTGIPSWWARTRDAEKKVRGATFVDTTHWYCVDGRCPIFTTTTDTVLKGDYLHTSVQYARQLAPDFAYLLRSSGVLP